MHRVPAVLGLVLLLWGCASADPRTYTLEATPGPALPGPVRTLAVRGVQLPRYLERNEIVRGSGDGRLRIAGNDWWGEPLRAMLQRVLAADLAQRMPAAEVLGTDAIGGAGTEIVLEVGRFEPDGGGAVVLTGHFAAEGDGHRRLLKRFDIQVPSRGGAPGDQVRAMSLALGRLADLVAASLLQPP